MSRGLQPARPDESKERYSSPWQNCGTGVSPVVFTVRNSVSEPLFSLLPRADRLRTSALASAHGFSVFAQALLVTHNRCGFGVPIVYLPDVELHEAATLDEAAALMAHHAPDARLLAGGTDLLVDLKTGRVRYGHLVSLNRIDALHGISETSDTLRIGALTTVTQLDRSPIVRERFSPILDATRKMAAPQVRNVATVGGNIASAVPCADLPPILTAMNASVALWSPTGQREVPLDAFFAGPRQTVRRHDEVLTAVLVPKPPPGFGAAYARFQLRDSNTIAVAAVAASLTLEVPPTASEIPPTTSVARASRPWRHRRDGGATGSSGRTAESETTVREARIVLGAVSPTPKLVPDAGDMLVGSPLDEDVIERVSTAAIKAAEPISDVRGSAEFRCEIVGVMTRRALNTAYRRIKEPR